MAVVLSQFAVEVEPITRGHLSGHKLSICGQEYDAWGYDTYIYDAITIAKNWNLDQVTFERVTHLRDWLRENIQHGHNIPFEDIKTITQTKFFIDQVISAEYLYAEGMEENKKLDLERNKKIFQSSTPKKSQKL